VERFNQYFATVFTTDPPTTSAASNNSGDLLHRYRGTSEMGRLLAWTLTIDVVISAISRPRADKAVGPDRLSPKLLLEVCNDIACPLLLLFEKSFNESPVFKKSDRNEIGNYRAVSLTIQICKKSRN